jgi:ATP-dependent DNA ligase
MRLPDPMLARPATLPLGSGYSYEVKWDGFRAAGFESFVPFDGHKASC